MNQASAWKPLRPCSFMVGTSGREARRSLCVTASARSLPALSWESMVTAVRKPKSVSPATRDTTEGALPL
ncbi:hypothetical protein D3C81_2125450 [compost metagenome]